MKTVFSYIIHQLKKIKLLRRMLYDIDHNITAKNFIKLVTKYQMVLDLVDTIIFNKVLIQSKHSQVK